MEYSKNEKNSKSIFEKLKNSKNSFRKIFDF